MYCPNCESPITEDQKFCATCGADLRPAAQTALQPAPANVLVPAPGQDAILIGRDPALRETNQCYLDHPAVSLHHARVERREATWYVVDLDSARGTFVNYQRVPPGPAGQSITEADTLWVAPYAFHVQTHGQNGFLQPAHFRLDAQGLYRTVRIHGNDLTLLDMRQTPLSFVPGEFIALVGGSGAGKTTLMKALNGLAPAQEGQVLIDGRTIIEGQNAHPFAALHSIVGYVPQDDVMHRELSVSELLGYVAQLRLADLSADEIARAIAGTLAAVELSEHAHKLVRQLSGGQRKRVNIAMELLARPRLLFLDEPTSGLDPGLDLEVMTLLRGWARGTAGLASGGRGDPKTIVLVTHATENIELCDYLAFMEPGGRLAYFGPPREAKHFFFPNQDPAQVSYAQIYRRVASGPGRDGLTWADVYQESPDYRQYVAGRAVAPAATPPLIDVGRSRTLFPSRSDTQTALAQFRTLAGRYARLILRDRLNAAFLLLQAPLVALLLGAVSSPQALRPVGALDAEKVLFILACAAVWLGIINAAKVIVAEQDIYSRERLYGLDAAPYVLSKMAVLWAIGLIQMALLIFFVNLILILPDRGVLLPVQVEYFVTLSLSMGAGLALGLLISALARSTDLATTLMFFFLIMQVIFSGLLFDPEGLAQVPAALTISHWSLQALGASTDLNRLLVGIVPGYDWNAAYRADIVHLAGRWLILGVYLVLCLGLAAWRQARK